MNWLLTKMVWKFGKPWREVKEFISHREKKYSNGISSCCSSHLITNITLNLGWHFKKNVRNLKKIGLSETIWDVYTVIQSCSNHEANIRPFRICFLI